MSGDQTQRAWKGVLLRWGGSALVLALLFFFLRRHLHELLPTIRRVPFQWWLLILLGYMGAHLVGVCKWRLMINLAGAEMRWSVAARCYFAGLFGNVFLPSLVGGDVIRAGMGMTAGRSRAGVLLGSFLDRLLDVGAMAAVAGTGALLLPRALDADSRRVFFGVALVFAVIGVGALAGLRLFAPRLPWKLRRKVVKVRAAGRAMAGRVQYVALAFVLALCMQMSFVILMARLSQFAGLEVPLHLWFFAYPLAKLSAMLPVTQGGIGVREAALAALLAPFGAPAVRTVAVGLVWETIVISGGLLGGLLALLLGRHSASTAPSAEPQANEWAARRS